ncbi:MAG: GNAT family N-acetyltransferase [Flavobacteriaceae bacterium]|nr:GNAT family N-acetyltransferase [Flavobacteriaceae bacterium]
MNYKTFETDRLILRPSNASDAAFFLELFNSPKWIKYVGQRNVQTLEDAAAYIEEKMTSQLARLGFSNYTVIRKSDNSKLGACGLYDREGIKGVDIGFAFLPQFEKKGYALESALKIKEAAIEIFDIKKISGITVKENEASQKLLEKLGLRFIKMISLTDNDEELMLYELYID